ncbi:hypothetical protein [Streptomyces sp. NPDC006446]|uniref:hypothetical protein n=1 Tax=Streptomyces sp. NPDC006446 TaxID=3154301 RepID=UPI00339EC9DA
MNGRTRARGLRRTVTAAAAAALVACVATGCRPMDTGAASRPDDVRTAGAVTGAGAAGPSGSAGSGTAPPGAAGAAGSGSPGAGVARQPAGPGGACVFVKPDGAQRLGHTGWGFRVTGTDRWEYGAVENPSNALYTPPGGDIGAWHARGTYARMLSDMSRGGLLRARGSGGSAGTPEAGGPAHPYSRYRCTSSPRGDVTAARVMIRTVAGRGFLVGVDPRTGEFGSRDCLDATYDILKAYRARHLTPAFPAEIPNVWVETLVLWSDHELTPG